MRILNKVLKNYGTYKNIIQNNLNDAPLNNINSISYDGSNLYILDDVVYSYNYDSNSINTLSESITIINGKRIEYSNGSIYILDNENLYVYNISTDTYTLLINGPINNFNCKTNYILYDKNNFIFKYNLNTHVTTKLTGVSGGTVDMASDNQNVYTCYDTYIQKTNYINNTTSLVVDGLSNIVGLTYDGLLLYTQNDGSLNGPIYTVYTKDGIEYTEQKISNLTGYQDIAFDGNYIYYTENNNIYRFDENNTFYNYNLNSIDKMRYNHYNLNNMNELVCLQNGNLVISNGNHFSTFELNYSNIIDYAYNQEQKFIINNSNIFVVTNVINEVPKTINLSNSNIQAFYINYNYELNDFIFTKNDGIISHVYPTSNVYSKVYTNDLSLNAITWANTPPNLYNFIDNKKLIQYTEFELTSTTVIKSDSLLNNEIYNRIEFDQISSNIYIQNAETGNIFAISGYSNVSNVVTLTTPIFNTYQSGNILYTVDQIKNIKKIDLDDGLIISDKNVKLDPECLIEYNSNILVGTNNYIRKLDLDLNELDSFTAPFFSGNIYDNYQSIKIHEGNIFICDSINYQIIKLVTSNTDVVSSVDYYPIELGFVSLSPIDIDINNNTASLYVGCLYNGYILKYEIVDGGIINQANIILKEKLERDIIINNIKYDSELDGILVVTDSGLYLIEPDLSSINTTFDNFNELNGIAYYNDYIYTFDQQTLVKYSNLHYLLSADEYIFAGNTQIFFNTIQLTNYNNPIKVVNNDQSVYMLDENNISYFDTNNINSVYTLFNYNNNQTANIIDMKVNSSNLLVLKDNKTIDILELNGGFISNIANIDAQIITLPDQSGNIYFISNDNKIKVYSQEYETIQTILENRGINIDEQNLYIYNNRVINAYQKNNTGMTQLDENTYYANNNKLYNLNNNGITEDLGISNSSINGITNDTANILMCTMNNVQLIDPFELTEIISVPIIGGLNNPFKVISVSNNYFVSDTFNHQIIAINKNTLVPTVIVTGLNYPRGIDYSNGYLYVADSGLDKIIKINANTYVVTDYSQNLYGVVDLVFSNSDLYLTSLLQNAVLKLNINNQLSTYLQIEKPYFIDNEIDFLISRDVAISNAVLSYAELNSLVNTSLANINVLIGENQFYNSNPSFKVWLDSQINNAVVQKNMNTKLNMLLQIEQGLNLMNGSMDYTDATAASIMTTFTTFSNRIYLILQSIMKTFRIYGP